MLPVLEVAADGTESRTDVIQPEPFTAELDQEEAQLTNEVEVLWQAHGEVNLLRKHTAAELRQLKLKLGERLHTVKQLLSRPGRGGQWNSFLRAKKIPRSSADRLIDRHLEGIGQVAPTGAIPAEDAIEKLLTGFIQKAKRLIPDDIDRYQFGYRLIEQLGLQVEEADESFIVLEPEVEPDEPENEDFEDGLLLAPENAIEAVNDEVISGAAVCASGTTAGISTPQKRQIEL